MNIYYLLAARLVRFDCSQSGRHRGALESRSHRNRLYLKTSKVVPSSSSLTFYKPFRSIAATTIRLHFPLSFAVSSAFFTPNIFKYSFIQPVHLCQSINFAAKIKSRCVGDMHRNHTLTLRRAAFQQLLGGRGSVGRQYRLHVCLLPYRHRLRQSCRS